MNELEAMLSELKLSVSLLADQEEIEAGDILFALQNTMDVFDGVVDRLSDQEEQIRLLSDELQRNTGCCCGKEC